MKIYAFRIIGTDDFYGVQSQITWYPCKELADIQMKWWKDNDLLLDEDGKEEIEIVEFNVSETVQLNIDTIRRIRDKSRL